nr:hypothetical protein Q903MT_gene920 [Picea sitchensis]
MCAINIIKQSNQNKHLHRTLHPSIPIQIEPCAHPQWVSFFESEGSVVGLCRRLGLFRVAYWVPQARKQAVKLLVVRYQARDLSGSKRSKAGHKV